MTILRRAVRSDKSADHFRSVCDALLRFKRWSVSKFGVFRGFKASEAQVAWFFLDNLVSDELDGHVSKTLYSGLKAASDTYKFPFLSAHLWRQCAERLRIRRNRPRALPLLVFIIFGWSLQTSRILCLCAAFRLYFWSCALRHFEASTPSVRFRC